MCVRHRCHFHRLLQQRYLSDDRLLIHVCNKHHCCYLSIFTLLSLFWNEEKMWGITFWATLVIWTVFQSETWSLSGGDYCWFTRSTREKRYVTRNNIIIIIIIIIQTRPALEHASLMYATVIHSHIPSWVFSIVTPARILKVFHFTQFMLHAKSTTAWLKYINNTG